MTPITVFLNPDGRLRLSFPFDRGVSDRLHLFGNAIEWQPKTRVWLLEADQFARLLRHFGEQVAVHPDVWEQVYASPPGFAFAEACQGMGVTLVARDGKVVALGENVSPVLEAAVNQRQDVLRQWCSTNVPERTPERSQVPTAGAVGQPARPMTEKEEKEWAFLQKIKDNREKWVGDKVRQREMIDKAKADRKAREEKERLLIKQASFKW